MVIEVLVHVGCSVACGCKLQNILHAHTLYFSTLQKINHLQWAISTITQLPFVKHRQESEYFNHFVPSCILKVTTDFFLLHSQVWQMFHNDNGGTELAMGWNSTELGDLLLKGKLLTFSQVKIYE